MKNAPSKNGGKDRKDSQDDSAVEELPIPLSVIFDEFWPRFREVIAFVGGFGIMMFEALADKSDRPWLFAAAIGMMGLPIARYAEGTLARWGSNRAGPAETPPENPPPAKRRRL